jgi:putative ABC transport system permease protein
MLIARQAVVQKIAAVKGAIGNTVTITPAGFSGFSSVNNSLTTSQLAGISALPHVTGVTETLSDRLTTIGSSTPDFGFGGRASSSTSGQTSLTSPVTINVNGNGGRRFHLFINGGGTLPSNFTPPVTITGTNNPQELNTLTGSTATLSSGHYIDGSKDDNQALVSSEMASKNNLSVGSTFTAYSATLTVAGIFKTTDRALQNEVVVSLPTEQAISGESGDVTNAVASVDSLDNLSSTSSAIQSKLGSSADVVSATQQADQAVSPLNSVKSIALFSLIGAVIAGAVIILLIMIMIVRERRREIGVLKAIGSSNARIMSQFMVEAVTLTVLGAVIGLVIGVAAGQPVTNMLVSNSSNSSVISSGGGPTHTFVRPTGGLLNRGAGGIRNTLSDIHTNVGWSLILYGLASAIVIAIAGSAAASVLIARVRPAEVMRVE